MSALEREKARACPHNIGLVCHPYERDCKKCGWHPEVDAKRQEALDNRPKERRRAR